MINRRNFIAAATGGILAPAAAIAQQPAKAWRIGILSATSRQSVVDSGYLPAFMEGMRALGHVEGKTFTIEWRDADGQGAAPDDPAIAVAARR
jgi:hypothetical protein